MFVVKRNGTSEEMKFDKITKRVKDLCDGLDPIVNPTKIAQQVTAGAKDGMTTQELDNLASRVAADMVWVHPDYSILSGRIASSNLRKVIGLPFSGAMEQLYNHHNSKGEHKPIISTETWEIVQKHKEVLDEAIDHSRDMHYDIFGFETLRKSYFLRTMDEEPVIWETPQYMLMRVAIGVVGDNIDDILEMYDVTSQRLYTHATPTLFNAGTPNAQMASCFLIAMKDDSIEGIFDTLKECALISKYAGGIGLHVHNIRSTGSHIDGTNGKSSGLVPFLRIYNETAVAVDQAGKRKGAFAIYLEMHHPDIEMFIDLRKNNGAPKNRTRDLFIALWASDYFFERVRNDEEWSLFDPDECPGLSDVYGQEYVDLYKKYESEGKAKQVVKAREIWVRALNAQIETGTPYVLNKDQVNKKSNQKNLGTIKSSNLCVAPETPILTDKGYIPIGVLKDKDVNVWNGEVWSPTTVRQTGVNQKLIKVCLSNGAELECTEYHKFYVETGSRPANKSQPVQVAAKDLRVGMKLIKHDFPIVENPVAPKLDHAYTQGVFAGDGSYHGDTKYPRVHLYPGKEIISSRITYTSTSGIPTKDGSIGYVLPKDLAPKFFVPVNYDTESKLEWLAGFLDADGTVFKGKEYDGISFCGIEREFIFNVVLLLQTLGCDTKMNVQRHAGIKNYPDGSERKHQTVYQVYIREIDVYRLYEMGMKTTRLVYRVGYNKVDRRKFVKVMAVVDEGRSDDTYCVTEPKRGMAMFNGVLTGNCAEIVEYTDKDETAVCHLASICLSRFFKEDGTYDFYALSKVAGYAVKNLNRVIDRGYYPVESAKRSSMRHRPLGLGVSGLHDVFHIMKISFDSEEAAEMNKMIFETIYRGAILQSIEEAKVHGPYETFEGSPTSQGIFQFNMWEGFDEKNLMWHDWDKIRDDMIKYGLRNSLLTSEMPTASSATIAGVNECFEIQTSNLYSRKVLSGEFTVVNKYLVKELQDMGLWNTTLSKLIMQNDGSVQGIESIPKDIQSRYRTVWEYSMKTVINMAADRGPFICQTQSMNIYFKRPTVKKMNSALLYAQSKGLKTLMYYLHSRSTSKAAQFTVGNDIEATNNEDNQSEECVSCSA
jgi:ribonucleoside-diphosphate reductase alpha chain